MPSAMENHSQFLVAGEAAQLEKLLRQNAIVERLVKKRQDGTIGQPTQEPQDRSLGEDVGVSVGNTINHYYPPPIQQPAAALDAASPGSPAAPAAASASATKAGIGKTLALAAALLGGSGIGAAVPWALGAYGKQAVTNTTIQQGSERQIGVEVIKGGASK